MGCLLRAGVRLYYRGKMCATQDAHWPPADTLLGSRHRHPPPEVFRLPVGNSIQTQRCPRPRPWKPLFYLLSL